jgi:hypothetical protein
MCRLLACLRAFEALEAIHKKADRKGVKASNNLERLRSDCAFIYVALFIMRIIGQ